MTGPDSDNKSRADVIVVTNTETVVRRSKIDGTFGSEEHGWGLLPWQLTNNTVHGISFANVSGGTSNSNKAADAITVTDTGITVRVSTSNAFGSGKSFASTQYFASDSRGCTYLIEGQGLHLSHPNMREALYSCSNRFLLQLQDGDLVLMHNPDQFSGHIRLWHSGTTAGAIALMQADGNFVIYDASWQPLWASNTAGIPGAYLALQNDGNLVIYDRNGVQRWTNNTCPRGPEMQVLPDSASKVDYCIDKTEVTRTQYKAWLDTNPQQNQQIGDCLWNSSFTPSADWPLPGQTLARGNNPVAYVDWCDAFAFCNAAGKRICGRVNSTWGAAYIEYFSEAFTLGSQWYNACTSRGVNTYPYGSTYTASTCNGASSGTVAVGSKTGCQSSVIGFGGVNDLSGNVFEWEDSCADLSGTYSCHIRGGAYNSNSAASLACANSTGMNWASGAPNVGIRCCADLTPP